ncbi:MAG: hypothetical protein ACI85Q_000496 [Salibacteraceae bacterium]|jgi:hypothetical protein
MSLKQFERNYIDFKYLDENGSVLVCENKKRGKVMCKLN